ncbi:MAG: cytochrome P460 family protein [Halioglobus sp.]|nr:cytochrome P460 family protein [Halioglobus sp.]
MPGFWSIVAAIGVSVTGIAAYSADTQVAYPQDYRDWTHLKSMVIHPGHSLADPFEGIHHIYANREARAGLLKGEYGTGATFVFDLLEYQDANGAGTEGARKFTGVMEYDARRFEATGGWGFEAFAGDSKTERVVADGGTSCFGCHMAVKDAGYVFSQYRK